MRQNTILEKAVHHTDWALAVLLLSAVIILILRYRYSRQFSVFLTSPFNWRYFNKYENKGGRAPDFFTLLASVVFYLSLPLAIIMVTGFMERGGIRFDDWRDYFKVWLLLILYFTLQNLLSAVLGWIFDNQKAVSRQLQVKLSIRAWTGLWATPLLFIALFLPWGGLWISYASIAFFASFYIVAVVRGMVAMNRMAGISYSYLILYLCALEILPLMILWKAVSAY